MVAVESAVTNGVGLDVADGAADGGVGRGVGRGVGGYDTCDEPATVEDSMGSQLGGVFASTKDEHPVSAKFPATTATATDPIVLAKGSFINQLLPGNFTCPLWQKR